MAHTRDHRSVSIDRTSNGRFTITNARDGRVMVGTGDDADFTPTELLLGAIGACTAVDVDILTSRRADPESFRVDVEADKVRDELGNHLTDIKVTFKIIFPEGKEGDVARAILPDAVEKSQDRLCTVGRTVESGTPIATQID
jgi:putative redox protein